MSIQRHYLRMALQNKALGLMLQEFTIDANILAS
jgi:hypothetical protein